MNETESSVILDSGTLTSGLNLSGTAASDKDQALPSPQTAIQDLLQMVDAEVAEQPFPKPKLNNYPAENFNPFKWIVDAPEFVPGEASSATSSNSNPAFAMTGENPSLHLQGPLALLTTFSTGNESYSNPLQNTQPLSLSNILNMNMEPWVRKMATDFLDNGWPADFAPPPGPYPLSNIDPTTSQWSLELQEWTQKYIAWQEGQRGEVHIRHRMCVRGWNAADEKVINLNRNLTRVRRQLERSEAAVKTARKEMEQANQDALADANVQKETITKLEEEVAQLKAEKDKLAGVGDQTEAIDRLQKQVARLQEENEKFTQNEPTLVSTVQRLTAQLEDTNETNRSLENALAMKTEEAKRGEPSPESSSRLQSPPARKEPCTHEPLLTNLREEKSELYAKTSRLQTKIAILENAFINSRAFASQTKLVCDRFMEEAVELAESLGEQIDHLREQRSLARNSARQFAAANDTLRDQKSHLEAAAEASNKQLNDLETKHQLETDGLHARIVNLEHDIHIVSEYKTLLDEDKRRLEHEINCLKREYKRKIKGPKEDESNPPALKEDAPLGAQKKRRKKKRKGQATQPAVLEEQDSTVQSQDGTVQKQESKQFDEVTLWDKLEMVVCVVLLLLLILDGWIH